MEANVKQVSIVGSGNVGHHLARALHLSGITINQIWSRNLLNATETAISVNAEAIDKLTDLKPTGLVLIAVPDDYVSSVIHSIDSSFPIAYTSGSIRLEDVPKRTNLGVFYPLQSFSKKVQLDLSNVPFLIEASNNQFENQLFQLAGRLSKIVRVADSTYREKVHLTAVWVNNFTNHILHQAWTYASNNGVDFELMKPLLIETINKLENDIPYHLQTGPAKRGDLAITKKQAQTLDGTARELYDLLTKSIIETYRND